MNIFEALDTIKVQRILGRTPNGRPITEFAIKVLDAIISDEKNYNVDVIKCENCCIITSSLLVPSGCPNCGAKDLTNEINK